MTPEKTVVLSAEAQRAVWAWTIISMIRDAPPPTSFEDSLRSRLLAAEIDTANLEFDLSEEFRNDVLEMFTVGKLLDLKIYKQERITDAMTKGSNSNLKRLIFYPTTHVSK
jgi:hypothetical protein